MISELFMQASGRAQCAAECICIDAEVAQHPSRAAIGISCERRENVVVVGWLSAGVVDGVCEGALERRIDGPASSACSFQCSFAELLNHSPARKILQAHMEWLDQVEQTLAPRRRRPGRPPATKRR